MLYNQKAAEVANDTCGEETCRGLLVRVIPLRMSTMTTKFGRPYGFISQQLTISLYLQTSMQHYHSQPMF